MNFRGFAPIVEVKSRIRSAAGVTQQRSRRCVPDRCRNREFRACGSERLHFDPPEWIMPADRRLLFA
jgi:hypothetical protein